ncbi:divalent-cation tolerance protein CutA [Streptomyces ochraceiscleroticus]|uniref:Divalent-cation tolerance protein CutA n=1 Tax=Streptomyces ochraceiscleroticus TaxID=47761 RepID=A0ABW1ME05_9ACTN|nr:divalent-cation tolerance protein CutA [Streptomyces ochraceiscleroticus]
MTDQPEQTAPPAFLTVLTTTDAAQKAEALARGAIEARLAACAQVSAPVTSVYRWDGGIETSEEWQVLLKTTGNRYQELEEYLRGAHDYDTPEIIATPVIHGAVDYLAWIQEETR